MFKRAGFTLVELMVVIAIIALLASVVIVNLQDARRRGSDSALRRALTELQGQMVLACGDTGLCEEPSATHEDERIQLIYADLVESSASTPIASLSDDNPRAWCVSVELRETNESLCTDASGGIFELACSDGECQ